MTNTANDMTHNDTTTRMREIDHTHPYDGRPAGRIFQRGPFVIADGGEAEAREEDEDEDDETMREVSHVPPHGDAPNDVHRRGRDDDE